jgi:predicted Zn-dependent protease
VWVEPTYTSGPTGIWEQRWHQAVIDALNTWQQHLAITLVDQPEQAQVLLERRRPPLRNNRASHGRAELQLLEVQRQGRWQLEPKVTVMISPGQAQPAIQATALHELGHAFGLWGHSDQAGDVMAAIPGGKPILQLTDRDLRTLQWLQQQPGLTQPARP